MMINRRNIFALVSLIGLIQFPIMSFAQNAGCDEACLTDIARRYMAEVYRDNPSIEAAREYANDVVRRDFSNLPWGPRVRYTENNVAMMIGEGFWGAARGDIRELLILADESTGNVIWYGITEEHEQAAYHGLRLKVENRKITEVESYLGREGTPDLFAPTGGYTLAPVYTQSLDRGERVGRRRLVAAVNDYFDTREQNNGRVKAKFTGDCAIITNGVDVTYGKYWAAGIARGCEAQLAEGIYKPVDRIRARRFPVVDEERGVVVALSIEDHAARYVDYESVSGKPLKIDIEYPYSRGMLEIFKVSDGKIARIDGISVFLPYYIHDLWAR